jgi:hypothetical protein
VQECVNIGSGLGLQTIERHGALLVMQCTISEFSPELWV